MSNSAFVALMQNAAWLLAMVVVFDLASSRQRLTGRPGRQMLIGLVLGALCMALIQTSFRFESGIIFDTRSVLLSASGLFFGTLPTLVAMIMTAAFRLLKGGGGAWTGVAVTFATGFIGIAWRRLRKGRLQDIRARELYALGLAAHLVMLALMLTLPWARAQHVLHDISLPVLLIYPVAGTILGLLLASRLRRQGVVTDLAASEERLRLALEAARMGTFEVDLQTRRMAWSRKHEDLWGFRPGEFNGTFEAFAARVHPDDLPGIQAEIQRCQDAHAPYASEFRVVWPDASVHWISSLGQFVYDDAGRATHFRGAAMEITARKQADDLRRESDERFRNLILRSPVPTGLVESDGTVSLINRRGTQMFGYTPADIPTIAAWWQRAFPDESYRQEALAAWNAALEQAVRENHVVEPMEFTITAKNGSRHVVEVSGLPLPGGGGMATFIDVTARHTAEARQRHLTDVLRAIRNVNQLIVHEKEPAALLRKACELLTESRGYRSAWIGQGPPDGQLRIAGEADGTRDLKALRAQLERGDWPTCCRRALAEPGVVVVPNTQQACPTCALAGTYANQAALAAAIRHEEHVYGVLIVALPRDLAADPEEQGLFAEVAGDIGFALHAIETEMQRQQVLASLLASEQQFRALVENAPDAIFIQTKGCFAYLNPAAVQLFGAAGAQQLLGTPVAARFPPDFRSRVAERIRRLNEDRQPVSQAVEPVLRCDGTTVSAEYTGVPIEYQGEPGALVFARDITERLRAEEKLRQSEAHLATALDMARASYWEYDVASDTFTFNDHFYRIFKTTAAAVGGYQMSSKEYAKRFCHPDDIPVVAREIEASNATQDPMYSRLLEHRILYGDGSVGYITVQFFVVKDAQGRTVKTYGVNQDITERKRAEEALREANAYHRRLIEASLDPLVTIGPDGRITDANAATETITGRGRQDLIGTDFADYFLEPERARDGYRIVLAEGLVRDYPLTIRHVSGRTTDVLYNASIYLNAAGQVQGVFAAAHDMTERNKADQALHESEEKFAAAFHASPNLIAITRLADGSIVDVNESYSRLLGYSREESLARTTSALSIWAHPADRDIFVARLRESGQVTDFETTLRRKDGSEIAVLDSAQIISLRGELYILSVAYDISERKKAEAALRESEARFRTLVDGAPEGIFVQADGRFLFLNPAMVRLLGAARAEDLLGTDILARIAPEFHKTIRERIRSQRETGTVAPPMEQAYLRLDGTRVPVETTAMPVRFGSRNAHLVFVRDISERQRTETEKQNLQAQLAQAQKMDSVGRLAGGVAHDFNNMLGVILGHAEMALEDTPPQHPLFTSLQEIRKAAIRSGDLTRQLLAFARKQTIAPRVLDLNTTVAGMLNMLRRLLGENIELAWHPGRAPLVIQMDPSQIDQVLANLCVNARDAIAGTGRITIATERVSCDANFCVNHPGGLPGDFVRLTVADSGCGMEAETLQHLFEPFFTTKEIGKGTGLGLATVYGIVKQNNGFILVDSAPGQGSTFQIHLPRHVATGPEPAPAAPPPPARGHETILLVEDEPILLAMTGLMLEQLGYRVLPAATPAEAIRLAKQNTGRIQLLMTDVVMPEMNGRELAKRLLADHPGLKRLFMSGYTADIIAHHGALDPGVHFIAKPYTPADLARKIREALAGADSSGSAPASSSR